MISYTKLIGALRNSATKKHNNGWSRQVGAGFIAEDIKSVTYTKSGLHFTFTWGTQTIKIGDLDLRETEEALKWTEGRQSFIDRQEKLRKDIEKERNTYIPRHFENNTQSWYD